MRKKERLVLRKSDFYFRDREKNFKPKDLKEKDYYRIFHLNNEDTTNSYPVGVFQHISRWLFERLDFVCVIRTGNSYGEIFAKLLEDTPGFNSRKKSSRNSRKLKRLTHTTADQIEPSSTNALSLSHVRSATTQYPEKHLSVHNRASISVMRLTRLSIQSDDKITTYLINIDVFRKLLYLYFMYASTQNCELTKFMAKSSTDTPLISDQVANANKKVAPTSFNNNDSSTLAITYFQLPPLNTSEKNERLIYTRELIYQNSVVVKQARPPSDHGTADKTKPAKLSSDSPRLESGNSESARSSDGQNDGQNAPRVKNRQIQNTGQFEQTRTATPFITTRTVIALGVVFFGVIAFIGFRYWSVISAFSIKAGTAILALGTMNLLLIGGVILFASILLYQSLRSNACVSLSATPVAAEGSDTLKIPSSARVNQFDSLESSFSPTNTPQHI